LIGGVVRAPGGPQGRPRVFGGGREGESLRKGASRSKEKEGMPRKNREPRCKVQYPPIA